jgi:cell division protein ZapA
MPQVKVEINGRAYAVQCDEGQEERVRGLAQYLEAKVAEFAGKLGQVGEARLLLLAGLAVADELAEATETLRRTRRQPGRDAAAAEAALANGLESLAQRIEAIAERLENPQL